MNNQHQSDPGEAGGAARLRINLDALAANWQTLRATAAPARCGAVVKADSYGLGMAHTVPRLCQAGCDTFFVAHVAEGAALRRLSAQATIYILNGYRAGTIGDYIRLDLRAVLGSMEEIHAWQSEAAPYGGTPGVALHVDTGMNRLGLPFEAFAETADMLLGSDLSIALLMSHLACAEEATHPLNRIQLERFAAAAQKLPRVPASLANSSGIALGGAYHFDLVRPGYALYGGNPTPHATNPMDAVVAVHAPVLDVRRLKAGDTISYGATYTCQRDTLVAVVGAGYADGIPRAAGDQGYAILNGQQAPIIGRVTMDMLMLDVSDVSGVDFHAKVGTLPAVELLGRHIGIDAFAANAQTIGYEVLTRLGQRYRRHYV